MVPSFSTKVAVSSEMSRMAAISAKRVQLAITFPSDRALTATLEQMVSSQPTPSNVTVCDEPSRTLSRIDCPACSMCLLGTPRSAYIGITVRIVARTADVMKLRMATLLFVVTRLRLFRDLVGTRLCCNTQCVGPQCDRGD